MELSSIASLGAGLAAARIEAQYTVAALANQIDVAQQLGSATVELIQAASLDPQTGQHLDLRV